MKKLILLLIIAFQGIALLAQDCLSGSATAILDANKIAATIPNNGELWSGSNTSYEYPKGSGDNFIFTAGLQLIAYDPSGNVRMASATYSATEGSDYYPGPIREDLSLEEEDCRNWDKIWSVSRDLVKNHRNDYSANGNIDNPIDAILGWPGRNNPTFESVNDFELIQDRDFAPFVDLDGDNIYEPLDGEYPAIKGDQNHWILMNDYSGPHFNSRASPLIMEISLMAYSTASDDEVINKTTFYDYTFRNRSDVVLSDFHFGLYVDFHFVCSFDKYLAFDEEDDMVVAYQINRIDSFIIDFCGLENKPDSILRMLAVSLFADAPSDKGLSHGVINNRTIGEVPLPSIINNTWEDGTPFTYGGTGYNPGSTDTVQFLYPDDPSDPNGWSMCTSGLNDFSRTVTILSGANTLAPGQVVTSTFAVILVDSVDTSCPSLDPIRDALDVVKTYNPLVSVDDVFKDVSIDIFPNPTADQLSIEAKETISHLSIYSIYGQVVQGKIDVSKQSFTVDMEHLPSGVYVVDIQFENGARYAEKVVKY